VGRGVFAVKAEAPVVETRSMDLSKLLDELYDDDGGEAQNEEKAPTAVPEPTPSPPQAAAPAREPGPGLDPLAADPELAAWLADMAEQPEGADESAAAPGPGLGVTPEPDAAVRLDDAVPELEPEPEAGLEAELEPQAALEAEAVLPLQDEPFAEPEPAVQAEPELRADPAISEPEVAVELEQAVAGAYPAPTPEPEELPTPLEPGRKWRRADDDILPGRTARADDRSAASSGERRGRWWGLRRRS
jgi:hypothetical protein